MDILIRNNNKDYHYYEEIPNECINCKWLDKDNVFCDKTHDSLIWGCACVKRFDNEETN